MTGQQSSSDVQLLLQAMQENTTALLRMAKAVEQQSTALMALVVAMSEADEHGIDAGMYLDGSVIEG